MSQDTSRDARPRLTTGVPGLDTILGGGFLEAGLYLVEGTAGAGKTILASQIAFHLAGRGQRALIITLVAESHGKLLNHLRAFEFFDESAVADRYILLSGLSDLLDGGIDGLLRFISHAINEVAPTLCILEGFATARDYSETGRALGKFLQSLNTLITARRCTMLLLAPTSGTSDRPEHSLVDGLLELTRVARGLRRAREIEVHKMRGGPHITGQHIFTIREHGIRIYPRLETVIGALRMEPGEQHDRVSTGIARFDEMTGGGLVRGSVTSLLGAPGVGKTLFGLTFLHAGAAADEPGLYFGFYEARERIIAKAERVGLPLGDVSRRGLLELAWQAPLEIFVDEVADRIDSLVTRTGAQRIFIDGLEGFALAAMHPERLAVYLTALTVVLRARGVTTIVSEELPIFSQTIEGQTLSVSALVENIVLMRYFEYGGTMRRLLSIIKMRESDFDPGIREFRITGQGIAIGEMLENATHMLGGQPRPARAARSPDGDGDGGLD